MQIQIRGDDGMYRVVEVEPNSWSLEHSVAISLKRIADALTYSTTGSWNLFDCVKYMSKIDGE